MNNWVRGGVAFKSWAESRAFFTVWDCPAKLGTSDLCPLNASRAPHLVEPISTHSHAPRARNLRIPRYKVSRGKWVRALLFITGRAWKTRIQGWRLSIGWEIEKGLKTCRFDWVVSLDEACTGKGWSWGSRGMGRRQLSRRCRLKKGWESWPGRQPGSEPKPKLRL